MRSLMAALMIATCGCALAQRAPEPRPHGGVPRGQEVRPVPMPPPVNSPGPRMSAEDRRALRHELREQREEYWRQRQDAQGRSGARGR